MSRKGKIYTYTIVYSAAEAFKDKTPYVVALVEEDGRRAMSLLEGYREGLPVSIGMEVEFVREDAAGNPIYKLA
jgi:uncharacterized OB-fold protein